MDNITATITQRLYHCTDIEFAAAYCFEFNRTPFGVSVEKGKSIVILNDTIWLRDAVSQWITHPKPKHSGRQWQKYRQTFLEHLESLRSGLNGVSA